MNVIMLCTTICMHRRLCGAGWTIILNIMTGGACLFAKLTHSPGNVAESVALQVAIATEVEPEKSGDFG